jgi:hypothetical protein
VAIADALDGFAARPTDRVALGLALARVRALRGLAALRDLPPLSDVVDAVERAAKPIELGDGPADRVQLDVFTSAARLLRRAASELRLGGNPDIGSPEAQAFAAAAGALADSGGEPDQIVPIAQLFFNDGQPDVVARAPNPPTTPAQRFRLEAVSQAEHLRRLVADARQSGFGTGRERVARELRAALRSLRSAAESFGEREIAAYLTSQDGAVAVLDAAALASLDEIAAHLASPSADRGELTRRLVELAGGGPPAPAPPAPAAPPPPAAAPTATAPTPRRTPALGAPRLPPARPRTPSGRELHAILDTGIARLGALGATPLSEPAQIVDEVLVPIETLLYRGRAALDRARELRDELRRAGVAPAPDALAELYDLLELATTE